MGEKRVARPPPMGPWKDNRQAEAVRTPTGTFRPMSFSTHTGPKKTRPFVDGLPVKANGGFLIPLPLSVLSPHNHYTFAVRQREQVEEVQREMAGGRIMMPKAEEEEVWGNWALAPARPPSPPSPPSRIDAPEWINHILPNH